MIPKMLLYVGFQVKHTIRAHLRKHLEGIPNITGKHSEGHTHSLLAPMIFKKIKLI